MCEFYGIALSSAGSATCITRKVQLLIQQQKTIIEAQRTALGKLPDVQLSEKRKRL